MIEILTVSAFIISVALMVYCLNKAIFISKKSSEELEFAVLGPSGVGKTLFLATLTNQLTSSTGHVVWGKYLEDEEERHLRKIAGFQIDKNAEYYQAEKRSTEQLVKTVLTRFANQATEPTIYPENLYLKVWGKTEAEQKVGFCHRLVLQDIPGRLFEELFRWKENGISETLDRVRGVILVVDAPALMQKKAFVETSGWRNYVDAVFHRLQTAKKNNEIFPVWIVLTKGDLLGIENLSLNISQWLNQIPKLPGIFPQESVQIELIITLISVCDPHNESMNKVADSFYKSTGLDKDKLDALYKEINNGMEKFYPVALKQLHAEEKRSAALLTKMKFGLFIFLVLSLFLFLEVLGLWNFYNLPQVPFSKIDDVELQKRADSLSKYLDNWWSQGIILPHTLKKVEEAKSRLGSIQNELLTRVKFNIMKFPSLNPEEVGKAIRTISDLLNLIKEIDRILLKPVSQKDGYEREFLEKIKEWNDYRTAGDLKPLLEFYINIPERQDYLKEFVKKHLLSELQKSLAKQEEDAKYCTGSSYFPDRLKPLSAWKKQYGRLFSKLKECFPDIVKDLENKQRRHWEYCWNQRKEEMERMGDDFLQRATVLRDFKENAPEEYPPKIEEEWIKLSTRLLSRWSVETGDRDKKKNELVQWFTLNTRVDSVLIEWDQFEIQVQDGVRRMLKSDHEQGEQERLALLKRVDSFLKDQEQAESNRFKERRETWLSRRDDIARFADVREVEIKVREYGANPRPEKPKWNDEFWEKYYPYLRIEVEGLPPLIFGEGKGVDIYKGATTVKFKWAPWRGVQAMMLDADGDIDAEKIEDDDMLHKFQRISSCLSLVDLTRGKIEEKDGASIYWYMLDLVNSGIPAWIMNEK